MLHRIMVPLDGSTFAEAALPIAFGLARRDGATVHLVKVHEPPTPVADLRAPAMYDPEIDEDFERNGRRYLGVVLAWTNGDDRARARRRVSARAADRVPEHLRAGRGDRSRGHDRARPRRREPRLSLAHVRPSGLVRPSPRPGASRPSPAARGRSGHPPRPRSSGACFCRWMEGLPGTG